MKIGQNFVKKFFKAFKSYVNANNDEKYVKIYSTHAKNFEIHLKFLRKNLIKVDKKCINCYQLRKIFEKLTKTDEKLKKMLQNLEKMLKN